MMKHFIIGFIIFWLFILFAKGEERVRCAEIPGKGEWHSYQVEGRKCWAKGRPGKYEPHELYWPSEPVQHLFWQQQYRWVDPQGWTHQE